MVKMSLGNSTSQGSSTSSISSSRISAYNGAISSLNSFIGASNLKGKAYNSAKDYASTVLIPLIQGAILLSEAVSNAVTTFPSRYTSEVAGEDLDSEVLEAQIATYQAAYDRSSAWLTSEMSKEVLNESSILRAEQSMARNLGKVTELQEKLDKLMAFNASSPSLFDEISGLYSAVSQGLSQVSSDYNSFNKTKNFPEYNSANLPWVQVINGQIETLNKNEGEDLSDEEINMIVEFYTSITSLTKDYNILDNDVAKRAAQLFNLLPSKLTKALMKSDGFWELTTILSDSSQTKLITALAAYEGLTDLTKTSKFGKGLQFGFSAYERYKEVISPVKTFVSSYLKASPEYSYIRATGKLLGKAGTYLTYADLAVTGVSSGVNEYGKTGSVGKAVIGGTIDAFASIGPLEGDTIGASIVGAIGTAIPVPILGTISGAAAGAVVGVAVGGVISLAKWVNPDIASDAKEFAYTVYDNTTEKIKKVGKVVASSASETVKTVSNYISGIGKAIDFGW